MLIHGDEIQIPVDRIKPELGPLGCVGLQQCLQRYALRLTEQNGGRRCIGAGIQTADFNDAVQRFELALAAPFHHGAARVINGVWPLPEIGGSHHPGKHRFVHLRFAELLQLLGEIKARRIGNPFGDGSVLKNGEHIRSAFNT